MRDTAPSTGRPTLDKPRSRRDAAKVLGIALQTRYRKLLEASGEDATVVATADLAQCMYENVEFVIWALKHVGGMNPPPPEELRRITPPQPVKDMSPEAIQGRYDRIAAIVDEPQGIVADEFPPNSNSSGIRHMEGFESPPTPIDLPCTCPPHDARLIGYKHMASCPKFVPA